MRVLHIHGTEMKNILKPAKGKTYLEPGAYENLGGKYGVGEEKARKMVSFAKKYTKRDLNQLIRICEQHQRVLNFGIVIQLLSVDDKNVRLQLQKDAAEGRWSKDRLRQVMKQRSATPAMKKKTANQLFDPTRKGKRPKAVGSVDALVSELLDDAGKWSRIIEILQRTDADRENSICWVELPKGLKTDMTGLEKAEAFRKFIKHKKLCKDHRSRS